MPDQDAELIALAKAGDRAALDTLLKRQGAAIRREVAARIPAALRPMLDEHDVMQVTYMEAYLNVGSFEPSGPGAIAAWLRKMAINNLRDAIRGLEADKRPDPRKRLNPGTEDPLNAIGATDASPSACARVDEARQVLAAALQRLPGDYRKVVQLCDLEGRPVPEVAASLGRTPGAVYMIRSRAHDLLRGELPPGSHILDSRS